MDMSHSDLADYHRAQAKLFHDRAQAARKHAGHCKQRRDFVGQLRADDRAKHYRRARDQHKAKANYHARQAPTT